MTLIERLAGLLAPHHCLCCGVTGELLCAWCQPEAFVALPSRCFRCHAATTDCAVCPKCRRAVPLRHVWVASEYDGTAKRLLHLLKFEHTRAAARPAAAALEATLPYLDDQVLVTHIPSATSRIRVRGYDQSALLAKRLALRLNCHHVTLLTRHGQSRQVGAKREQRLKQLDGAFQPRRPELIKNAHIILIDDVVTTGATLTEAAKVLKVAGAKTVDAAVFAQAQ